jgi:type IV secretory pathway ATPase VirB11/archaellum biosynthesis ATPase
MINVKKITDLLINKVKNMQEFTVFRDIEDIVFDGSPLPYTINHTMGEKAELTVPAISQEEAERLVDQWLQGQTT